MSTVLPHATCPQLAAISAVGPKPIPESAFLRWHHEHKFRVMADLLAEHLPERGRLLDVGCGDGDTLVLARQLRPEARIFGLDLDEEALAFAARRVPDARLAVADMQQLEGLQGGTFDVVHEFGAAYLLEDWNTLARAYLHLVRPGGIVLWELPRRWSFAHLAFLTLPALRREGEPTWKRLLRSLKPGKFTFLSDREIDEMLRATGIEHEVIEERSIWNFFGYGRLLDRLIGDQDTGRIDTLERVTSKVWPRSAGFYLVLRRAAES